jgi:transmembrane channel-like protein
MAQSYRKSFIQTSGNIENLLSHKVFCSWDWGIANQKAANLKHNNIHSEFRELLEAITEKNAVKVEQTRLRWFWNVTSQGTGHLLVLGLIFGIAFGMWEILAKYNGKLASDPELAAHSATPLILPVTVSLTMLTMQILFKCLS